MYLAREQSPKIFNEITLNREIRVKYTRRTLNICFVRNPYDRTSLPIKQCVCLKITKRTKKKILMQSILYLHIDLYLENV